MLYPGWVSGLKARAANRNIPGFSISSHSLEFRFPWGFLLGPLPNSSRLEKELRLSLDSWNTKLRNILLFH